MSPMAITGQEAIGSMGGDAPISALSEEKPSTPYFKQNCLVTNPPIDPIREELVMSLVCSSGPGRTSSTRRRRRGSGWRCASRSSPTRI